MNKYFIIILIISFSSVHAYDDESAFEKGIKITRGFLLGKSKEKKQALPRLPEEKKPHAQTRPMPIILEQSAKPAEQKIEADLAKKEELKTNCDEKQSLENADQNASSTVKNIGTIISNHKGKIVIVAVLLGAYWLSQQIEAPVSSSQD